MKLNKIQRSLLLAVAAIAILGTSFFGTLFVMNYIDREARDAARTETVKSVMAALEKYRASKGAYPILPKL